MRLAFLNVQSGVGVTGGYWQYALRGHRYLFPHDARIVAALAELIRREELDVLACAEMDAPSWRSGGVDYVTALAESSRLHHAAFFTMTRIGRLVHQGNSIHCAAPIRERVEHVLPGGRQRRVLGEAQLETTPPATIFVTHLSLARRHRERQIARIAEIVRGRPGVIVVGDFNSDDPEELRPLREAGLQHATTAATYPTWRPRAAIDHLLASPDVQLRAVRVDSGLRVADHLPIVAELSL